MPKSLKIKPGKISRKKKKPSKLPKAKTAHEETMRALDFAIGGDTERRTGYFKRRAKKHRRDNKVLKYKYRIE